MCEELTWKKLCSLPALENIKMLRTVLVIGISAILSLSTTAASKRLTVFAKEVAPLLDKHCNRCHGKEKTKGDIDLTILKSDRSILENSADILIMKDALLNGDMPPKPKKTGFTDEHKKVLVSWIENYIEKVDFSDPVYRDPGPSQIRQLTTDEYNRTVKSLLGVEFNINKEVGAQKEHNVKAFSNQAATLQISPLLIEKYFTAADKIIEKINSDKGEKIREELFKNVKAETAAEAMKFFHRISAKAYRRKVSSAEIRRLLPLYNFLRKEGKSFQQAVAMCLKPILVSPYFLQRIEANRAPRNSKKTYLISDIELAVRLSYFLWSTMPDDELFKIAVQGKFRTAEVITAQIDRMLKDKKSSALVENFMAEWLEFENIIKALPGTRDFPSFNNEMKNSMREETKLFVKSIIQEDLSIINFLDSDFTYVNEKLARLYGIPGVRGKEMVKVDLKPEYNRGGLLGMGSILAMTSHTNRTKPTARGKWVAEVILGTKIPEPPADVEALPNDKKSKQAASFREKLAQHVADASCAVCHKKMDPLGFALDNYNAIGQWRNSLGGEKIDNTGVLPDGTKVAGAAELKKVILDNKDQFVRNLFSKMLSYAIGRKLEFYDELTIRKAVENIKKADYKFSAVVMEVVKSRPFLYRRNIENYYSVKKQ